MLRLDNQSLFCVCDMILCMKHTRNQEDQYRRMTETPVSKLIFTLGIPTVISMLVTNIYNMADTYFVGSIGTSASGATGVVFALMGILQAFGFMYGHGAGSHISRKLGARDVHAARKYSAVSFYLSIFTGLFIMIIGCLFMDPLMRLLGSTETILPYARTYAFYILIAGPAFTSSCVLNNILRYERMAFFAMIGLTSGGILNIFGDALLVNVFHMGIAGAGISTAVSQYISMFILMVPYIRRKTQSSIAFSFFHPTRYIVKDIVSVGMPSLLRQGLNSASSMVLNLSAGIYGDAAVATISIVSRIMNFLSCVAIGIGQGFQPVSAFNYGAGFYSRVKEGYLFSLKAGTVLMFMFALAGFVFSDQLVMLFRNDPMVIEIGTIALKLQCISLVLMPVSIFGNMLFQSIGLSKTASFLAALRSGIVLIPVVLLLSHLLGITGLECSQAVSEAISALITLPISLRFIASLPPDQKA